MRKSHIERKTKETEIGVQLNLDGSGIGRIASGIAFFDHMLTLFAAHGDFDLELTAKGDIEVDYHHTVEDMGIVLGQAIKEALGERKGISRYGFFVLPMDEALARVALDLSNRPFLVYDLSPPAAMIKDLDTALFHEFFQALAVNAGMNLHIDLIRGEEAHHVFEAVFKAFARALKMAVSVIPGKEQLIPSTKGSL